MLRVASLGFGRRGLGMASCLLPAEFELSEPNRTAPQADALAAAGTCRCATPRQAGLGASAMLSRVADDAT